MALFFSGHFLLQSLTGVNLALECGNILGCSAGNYMKVISFYMVLKNATCVMYGTQYLDYVTFERFY